MNKLYACISKKLIPIGGILSVIGLVTPTAFATSVNTAIDNNVMTIGAINIVATDGTQRVVLNTNGMQLPYLGASNGVLKLNAQGFIAQGLVQGSEIQNNSITSTQLANGSITSVKIASGTITSREIAPGSIDCSKLAGILSNLCEATTAPNASCPTGQFLQGFGSGGVAVCTSVSSSGSTMPTCSINGEIPMRNQVTSSWECAHLNSPTGTSLWEKSEINQNHIYNANLTGRVGIGTSNPQETLHVSGSLLVQGNGSPQTYVGAPTPDATAVLYVGNSVGIYTKSPSASYALDVVGKVRAYSFPTPSDIRLKTDIVKIPNALDKILQLNGYSYTLKGTDISSYGVIAQEVEKVFPYAVSTDENDIKAVNYNSLLAPVIESIKTLNQNIQEVSKITQSNASRLDALEKKIK